MTKQEINLVKYQINKLEERKSFLIAELVGACEEINHEIRCLKKQLKEQNE